MTLRPSASASRSSNNPVTPRYEALLLGFYAAATGREAKGLARLALAQYLVNKAKAVVYARSVEGRPKTPPTSVEARSFARSI